MFDHVTVRVSNREASERLYETVLQTLGIERSPTGRDFSEWNDFSLGQETDERPVTKRLHIGFASPSHEHVDAF